jgi:DNA-binding MarR family transcriptional regulator
VDREALLNQCALFDVHRLSRVLTSMYNARLRESGLTMVQFTLLRNLAALQSTPLTKLARALDMERTSVTRLLAPLQDEGLIAFASEEDRRVRNVQITKRGLAALKRSEPAWREAQETLLGAIGEPTWMELRTSLRKTLRAVREASAEAVAD